MKNFVLQNPRLYSITLLASKLNANAKERAEIAEALKARSLSKCANVAGLVDSADFLLKEGILTRQQILRYVFICLWSPQTLRRSWQKFPRDFYMKVSPPVIVSP